jgi:8-oxo-dGTP diphosphatase
MRTPTTTEILPHKGDYNLYCVGFMFSEDGRILLVQKNRPQWQAGLLNGIGGKVEKGEVPMQAMVREFEEETGIREEGWEYFAQLRGDDFVVVFYRVMVTNEVLDSARTMTDEHIVSMDIQAVIPFGAVPNLAWLIPMARLEKYTVAVVTTFNGDEAKEG